MIVQKPKELTTNLLILKLSGNLRAFNSNRILKAFPAVAQNRPKSPPLWQRGKTKCHWSYWADTNVQPTEPKAESEAAPALEVKVNETLRLC